MDSNFFTATLTLRCRAKGQPQPTCQDLKKVLQKCRKEGGSRHRKWLKMMGRPPVNNPPAEDSVGSDVENQIFVSEVGPLITVLIGDIMKFEPQSQ